MSFAQLASRLAVTYSKPKSVITHDLYGRLNTCIMISHNRRIDLVLVISHAHVHVWRTFFVCNLCLFVISCIIQCMYYLVQHYYLIVAINFI